MTTEDEQSGGSAELRRQAEEIVRERAARSEDDPSALPPREIRRMVHELHVHQIELNMQNEELRRAQDELEASRARYFDLYDLAPLGYLTVDEKGLIVEANLTATALLGVSRSGLVAQPLTRFILQKDQDTYYRHRKRLLETGEPQACELRLLKTGETAFWGELSATLAQDADGSPLCRVALNDITERRRAAETLQANEERLEATARIAKVGGWEIDLQGNTLAWTEETFRIHELAGDRAPSVAEAIQFYHPDDQPIVAAAVQHAIEHAEDFDFEARLITARQNPRWVRATGVVISGDGGPIEVRGMVQDITERKLAEAERMELEAQLNQAQKMESVGRLAGGVAHDFNNMLGVILGHTEMALDRLDPEQPLYGQLVEIRKAAERSADLTRQLLAFARKQTVSPKVLDLNEAVERALKMLRRLIGEDIDLTWLPGRDLMPVKVDPSQIDQILANLCVNARHAITDTGKITIETGGAAFDEAYCARHAGFLPGVFVTLAVRDDGCGIDHETLTHVFEPFFTTKKVDEGTGLGLSTVYGIVRQNDGFIDVSTEPEQGTTFTIYLPRHAGGPERVREQGTAGPAAQGRETVLLVEDEPAILRMTSMMLEGLGYTVLPTATPGEAIRLAREHAGRIDLLMTDVVMPEMNGRDLAKNVLSLRPDIRRLFMSGYTANVIAHRGVLDEGVHFIQKPFSQKGLGAKLREALGDD